MKTALAIALMLVQTASAQPTTAVPGSAIPIRAGEPAPADGVFQPTADAMELFRRCKRCELEKTDLQKALTEQSDAVAPAIVVGGSIVLVGLGFLVGFLVFRQST